jgi:L-cysteine:1D-myo-inositol 2-amino-2-deoxy-alpha-D-glucopyranoside ligase
VNLYNTLTRKVEPFAPIGKDVGIYVCGITPYDTTHIGHAFTYTSVDILIRYLRLMELKVTYVQNVTDIDDDILRKAAEVGEDWDMLGNRWTAHYIQDMKSLNVIPPDYFPRATEVIPEIIQWVLNLLEAGVAYESGGCVYYDVYAWSQFGKLCAIPPEERQAVANERGNKPDDPHKRDPLDFVLWQAQAPGEPAWESPWGPGRPGWHIECSTMATMYLGAPVDIHGGGADLCFPHHEGEIAQFEPLNPGDPFVRYWMHVAMVEYEGAKMSKSLGNLVMVRDLLGKYSPDALRLYLGGHHYRDNWSFSERELRDAQNRAGRIVRAFDSPSGKGHPLDAAGAWASFVLAMDDDLDTPAASQVLEDLAEQIQDAAGQGRDVSAAREALSQMGHVFGLRLYRQAPDEEVIDGWNRHLERFASPV